MGEARYPQKLCVAVVHVVLQVLHSQGLQLLPDSISAIADSPLHRSQLASVALNKQPISGKIPPLIPEFSKAQVISLSTDEAVPVSVLSKLQKAWNPDPAISLPVGSRLLRCTRKIKGVEDGVHEPECNVQELAFGIPWTIEDHIAAAVQAKHPMDILEFSPKSLSAAVDKHFEWGASTMSAFRIAWCRKWFARSQELDVQEREQANSRAQHVYRTTLGKRVLLIKETLTELTMKISKQLICWWRDLRLQGRFLRFLSGVTNSSLLCPRYNSWSRGHLA